MAMNSSTSYIPRLLIEKVAPADVSVLILGESGTGKELIARAVHKQSGRRDGRFVAINCAAIPEQLLESELFGYEKGAFTGAVKQTIGKVELASGGKLLGSFDGPDRLANPAENWTAKSCSALQDVALDCCRVRDSRLVNRTHDFSPSIRKYKFD